MNALTETEILAAGTGTPVKGDYRQNQFGGSFGGPILQDQAHFFAAVERTQAGQDPGGQHPGAVPRCRTACLPCRTARHLFTGKVTANLNANQFLSVRYGRDTNSQPYNAAPNSTLQQLGRQREQVQLDQPEPQLGDGGSKLNEFIFQYADFGNTIASRSSEPNEKLPERRDDRRQRQHAADDRADEVSVPRRLLVAHERRRRPRPRLQGRRELHQRAAACSSPSTPARASRSTRTSPTT